MMTISDIYDALTATDRPYKRAVPRSGRSTSCTTRRRHGRLDAALLETFVEARVFDLVKAEIEKRRTPSGAVSAQHA